jgi:hypothetical protein
MQPIFVQIKLGHDNYVVCLFSKELVRKRFHWTEMQMCRLLQSGILPKSIWRVGKLRYYTEDEIAIIADCLKRSKLANKAGTREFKRSSFKADLTKEYRKLSQGLDLNRYKMIRPESGKCLTHTMQSDEIRDLLDKIIRVYELPEERNEKNQ